MKTEALPSFCLSRSLTAGASCLLLLTALGACRKDVHLPAPAPQSSWNWIDLEPGWRIRVITPIQKSGSYIVRYAPNKGGSLSKVTAAVRSPSDLTLDITVTADDDLLGYETSFYLVTAHPRGGVTIAFQSAIATIGDSSTSRSQPVQPLFKLPRWARSVRLLHMVRASSADHNAAILAARNVSELDRLTALVEANPSACRDYQNSTCQWIPAGVAVRPERFAVERGVEQWVPVR
jgi:hypothetical protein